MVGGKIDKEGYETMYCPTKLNDFWALSSPNGGNQDDICCLDGRNNCLNRLSSTYSSTAICPLVALLSSYTPQLVSE